MKAFQDRCVANEGVRTFNKELTDTLAKLKEETRLKEEAKKVRTNLTTELSTLREQMDKAKTDAVMEFPISQPFFDVCGAYYSDGFDDCLKQVGVVYLNLDLSQITIDGTISPTPREDDTISEETSDSIHIVEQGGKDTDAETVVKLVLDGSKTLAIQSTVDPSTTNGLSPVDPITSQAPLS